MAHGAARQRRHEADGFAGFAEQRQGHLPKPEQIEMIDEEGDDEHGQPAERECRPEYGLADGVLDRPDLDADRALLRDHEHEGEARRKHIGGTLDRRWNDLRPARLEPAPRHDTVLDRNDREQQAVDREGGPIAPTGVPSRVCGTAKPPTKAIA